MGNQGGTNAGASACAPEAGMPPAAKQPDAVFKGRIDAMYGRDRLFGLVFVVWLWITYGFTYFAVTFVSEAAGGSGVQTALLIGGALVIVYNTASIGAMIKHYAEDKEFIYAVDLRHLDRLRAKKKKNA